MRGLGGRPWYLDIKIYRVRVTFLSTPARRVGKMEHDPADLTDRDPNEGYSWRAPTALVPRARWTSTGSPTRSTGSSAVEGDGLDVDSLPFSLKVLLENLLRTEDGEDITADDIKALAGWDADAEPGQGDPVHAGARDHAGLHRRAVRRRPRHDARGDGGPRRRPVEDQPARAGRDGHRPLRDRRRLRHARGLRAQRRDRVRAQQGALPVPALGPGRVRRLQGRPARHRHRPPGQHRAPRPRGLHP